MIRTKATILTKKRFLLAIETSCDDTSIAIFNNKKLLVNYTLNSVSIHKKYGGIVPELAARSHCAVIDKVFNHALKQVNINVNDITDIAYTAQPGLIGSLHIGKVFANQLSSLLKIKPIKVNHIHAHIFSYFIDHDFNKLTFPSIALVVSGGHTFIALIKSINVIKILNSSCDDAVGEVLDKVGRYLGFPYPGGISIDKFYQASKIIKIINHQKPNMQFSFSGIKTATLNMINKYKQNKMLSHTNKIIIASSTLEWICNDLLIKLKYYCEKYHSKNIIIGGGVSANRLLRSKILAISNKINILLPTLVYTNDNAAMIGVMALLKILFKNNHNK